MSAVLPSVKVARRLSPSGLLRPSFFVALLYIIFFVVVTLLHHYTAMSYVHLGTRFALHIPTATPGYDGQFYYQIARDPLHAAQSLDKPPYRYQRIVYALLVFVLSAGQTTLVSYMLLLVNFVRVLRIPDFDYEVCTNLKCCNSVLKHQKGMHGSVFRSVHPFLML